MSRGRGPRTRRAPPEGSVLPRVDSLIPAVPRIAGHLKSLSVAISCQHHEVPGGTMCPTGLDVDASNVLKIHYAWSMVSLGAWLAKSSKPLSASKRKLMGFDPLPCSSYAGARTPQKANRVPRKVSAVTSVSPSRHHSKSGTCSASAARSDALPSPNCARNVLTRFPERDDRACGEALDLMETRWTCYLQNALADDEGIREGRLLGAACANGWLADACRLGVSSCRVRHCMEKLLAESCPWDSLVTFLDRLGSPTGT